MDEPDFQRVLTEGRALQARLAGLAPIAVGGTVVTSKLSAHFEEVKDDLGAWDGWRTNRLVPPVLILGEHGGVELGVRQLRRSVPLQTTQVAGLRVPTAAEMLRVKAFLLVERRSVRDFVDVAALATHLDSDAALRAMSVFNHVYGQRSPQTWVSAFAEACESEPVDATTVSLSAYKGLNPPFTDWEFVAARCHTLGRELLKLELASQLASALPANWPGENPP